MADEQSGSPVQDEFQDEEATPGNVSGENGVNGDAGSDEEDDIQGGSRRRKPAAEPADQEEQDDLFGDDEDEAPAQTEKPTRQLDDEELDSGDDEGRADRDRAPEEEAEQFEERELLTMDTEISRQAVPEPSDGEMYLLKVPQFMSIEPQAWQTTTFQPPTAEHHSKKPSSTFSAYNTALSTIRWRHSPSNPTELQSNARINRWSDGSLTLQLASDPNVQYEIDGNPLAPPQRNPIKPTPISVPALGGKGGRQGMGEGEVYDYAKDAFTYLIVPVAEAEALRVTHKVTAGLSVKQTESAEDDAILQLQTALASAANATKVGGATGTLEATEFDPELQRKEAEQADRMQARERKKRENAQERERLKTDRALGGRGLGGRSGALSVGMLEDDEEGEGRGRFKSSKARAKPRRRRNSEYSEDEDMGRKRFTREDSYDEEDDFIAGSEEEVVEDDDDPDDGIVESPRRGTPKRDRPRPAEGDDDEDAEGEPDDDVPQARTKRRRVVDDDDEEE